MAEVRQLRDKQSDNEKITINLGFVDLGRIDLLVQEGFYSNRSDFIRTAIRKQLDTHGARASKQKFSLGYVCMYCRVTYCDRWYSNDVSR